MRKDIGERAAASRPRRANKVIGTFSATVETLQSKNYLIDRLYLLHDQHEPRAALAENGVRLSQNLGLGIGAFDENMAAS
ncbi:MAG: hypothetical protein Q7O66_08515 [Dehalococcoidia bacterium]|nr:hypothetical protein [Dehalococcoidia bacterium]